VNKKETINASAVKYYKQFNVIAGPACVACGSERWYEIPLHEGETIRLDCAECEKTCHKHWYRRRKRHKKDKGYHFLPHYPCKVCRITRGFSKWHGVEVEMQPILPDEYAKVICYNLVNKRS